MVLAATDAAKQHFLEKGFSMEYGAREMSRVIQEEVKRKLADELLFGALVDGGKAEIDVVDGEVVVRATPKPPRPSDGDGDSPDVEDAPEGEKAPA